MCKGVFFRIEKGFIEEFLGLILEQYKDSSYYWCIDQNQSEVWSEIENENILQREVYETKELIEALMHANYISFLKIEVYRRCSKCNSIINFEEVISKQCEAIILVVDGCFVEIYSLNENTIQNMQTLEKYLYCKEMKPITEGNMTRKDFNIF